MNNSRETAGRWNGQGRRFAVVASRFNATIVDTLVEGAADCLERHGVAAADVVVVRVPGAWEIPFVAEELASRGGLDGIVALGVLIRGETSHYDHLCSQCTVGLARVASEFRIPIGFGVLTCENSEQARERAGGKMGNKGWDAALAVLEMADLVAQLRGG
jgi:6,7-dimethyl-8-ribityllumazine synthase